jgi:phosphatidylethanolamine-binding protein
MISSKAKGLLIMIDPDVSIGGRKITYLHWLSPNVDLSNEKAVVPTSGDNMVKYFQPSPPAGDPPHRYTFLLYSQPDNFSIPAKFANLQRSVLGFNVNAFATAAGLGQPKAASFMQVER